MIECHFVTLSVYKNLKLSKLCSFIIFGSVWCDCLTKTKSRSRRIAFQIFKMVPILKRFQKILPIKNSSEISHRKPRLQNFFKIYLSVRSISWLHNHSQTNLLFVILKQDNMFIASFAYPTILWLNTSFEESARL